MSHLSQCFVNVMPPCYMSHLGVLPSCYVPSRCIAMGASLKYENVVFNGEQKKESFV